MLLIRNGRVLDPASGRDEIADICIEDGKIAAVGKIPENFSGAGQAVTLHAQGLCVAPGLVDMHVHFRDPGFTSKEDSISGAAAAAAGGVTSVACMPNTKPVGDTPQVVRYIKDKSHMASANVFPIGAVTVGQRGERLTDFAALKQAGVVALSDDGVPVDEAVVMRAALFAAQAEGMLIITHCEDRNMVQNYAVNEGAVSKKLGLPGRPAIAETLMVARDAMLAADTGGQVHIAHVSTAGSVDVIRRAKAAGVPITCETCPQYFSLTQDTILTRGSLARVNPPLRTEADVEAITAGLMDGTIDCIVTDHAPHSAEEKARGLVEAPSGMVGLETSLALAITVLHKLRKMPLLEIIRKMSWTPAQLLGIGRGRLAVGAPADLVLFDPEATWVVDRERFRGKSNNTPYEGYQLYGRVKYTLLGGKIVYQDGK